MFISVNLFAVLIPCTWAIECYIGNSITGLSTQGDNTRDACLRSTQRCSDYLSCPNTMSPDDFVYSYFIANSSYYRTLAPPAGQLTTQENLYVCKKLFLLLKADSESES